MEKEYLKEQQYLNAKKRVKEIKGFYSHLLIYILINIFISGIIIFGLTYNNISLSESFNKLWCLFYLVILGNRYFLSLDKCFRF